MGLSPENLGVYHLQKNSKISVGKISVRKERVLFGNKSRHGSLQAPLCSLSVAN